MIVFVAYDSVRSLARGYVIRVCRWHMYVYDIIEYYVTVGTCI